MRGTVRCALAFLAVASIFLSSPCLAFPQALDDASLGPASEDNPFFGRVLAEPVTDGSWSKLAETIYQGPTGTVYVYDRESGRIARAAGMSRIGERIYDADGRLVALAAQDRDRLGVLLRTRVYGDFRFDRGGNLAGYARTHYDRAGSILSRCKYDFEDGMVDSRLITFFGEDGGRLRTHQYDGYEYDDALRVTRYRRTDRNASGDLRARFAYGAIARGPGGRIASYERTEYGPQGDLANRLAIFLDEHGLVRKRMVTVYDGEGNIVGRHRFLHYVYDDFGQVEGYDVMDMDAAGALQRTREYRDISYHPGGMRASATTTERGPTGEPIRVTSTVYARDGTLVSQVGTAYDVDGTRRWRARGFSHDAAGQVTAFELDLTDAEDNVIERGVWNSQ